MHFTEPIYRNPYWPTRPLLEVTSGCMHNKCKFCTMYKSVRFGVAPMAQIEADLAEIASVTPHARTIQLLSANPFALSYDRMVPILEKINKYLPDIEHILSGPGFLSRKDRIIETLRSQIERGNLDRMARIRAAKTTL